MERSSLGSLKPVADRWDADHAAGLSPLAQLAWRSNMLASDRAIVNFGGGNTSAKWEEADHTGKPIRVMYVKGSGSDLATITEKGFTGYRFAELEALLSRDQMTDADMVAYLGRSQLAPDMPRGSIETLLHAFVPAAHVDHTHPDAINMLACTVDGENLVRECFGDEAIWIPYIRPGFLLAKQVGEAVREHPDARCVILAKHGLVTWGDAGEESYARTIEAINRAAAFVAERIDSAPFGDPAVTAFEGEERDALLGSVLPVLRGAVSQSGAKILTVDTSDDTMAFVCGSTSPELSQVGTACPDHLVHTKMRPLWIDFDPANEGVDVLTDRLIQGVQAFREAYTEYFRAESAAHVAPDGDTVEPPELADPNPRVVLIQGVGMIGIGPSQARSALSRDLYERAIQVMGGAQALGGFNSLTDAEAYAVEYWPLELYKLTLAPAPKELAGQVALVTGGAGGIGRSVLQAMVDDGACVVVADIDRDGAASVASEYGASGLAVTMDVTDEAAVDGAYREAVLAFGGIDIVVSNAGLASSAPIEETTVKLWDLNHAVLTKGYFLVSRAAFRLWRDQHNGGNLVFIASKNAVVAGKNAAAYSSAKAAELHLARCLAEEGGSDGIRVNVVNPDAVLQGSRIWDSSWREERAAAYGIAPEQLEEHYRNRTVLKVNVVPDDIAEAVRFFVSSRSGKTTGNFLNVDGGVGGAYPR